MLNMIVFSTRVNTMGFPNKIIQFLHFTDQYMLLIIATNIRIAVQNWYRKCYKFIISGIATRFTWEFTCNTSLSLINHRNLNKKNICIFLSLKTETICLPYPCCIAGFQGEIVAIHFSRYQHDIDAMMR
jgi:hypothetical protein